MSKRLSTTFSSFYFFFFNPNQNMVCGSWKWYTQITQQLNIKKKKKREGKIKEMSIL